MTGTVLATVGLIGNQLEAVPALVGLTIWWKKADPKQTHSKYTFYHILGSGFWQDKMERG